MTRARHRALDAHLQSLRRPTPRTKPGSYAWPDLRRHIETGYAHGTPPLHPHHLGDPRCPHCTARTPSRRTLQRWHAERRWLNRPP